MTPTLHRYWIKFDLDSSASLLIDIGLGCGVTAFDEEDALQLVQDVLFDGHTLPEVKEITADIDISSLDQNHVLPNMGIPIMRGIWFPKTGL